MKILIEFMFRTGGSYDELRQRLLDMPKSTLQIVKEDAIDKRRRLAKRKGWLVVKHSQQKTNAGEVKLIKNDGFCRCEITDESNGKLTGAWTGWITRNAADLVYGLDLRIPKHE